MNSRFVDSAWLGESIDSDGSPSLSVIVPTPVVFVASSVALVGLFSVTRTVSSASSSASSVTVTVIVCVVVPVANVRVPAASTMWSLPEVAVPASVASA